MGAKITLTGVRTGKVRKTSQHYSFDMVTGGSKNAPKGLPVASANIEYTIFVSLKAGKKAGLDSARAEQKWLIQGELILDLPVDKCPGEIGIIAFQISALSSGDKEQPQEISEPKVPIAEQYNQANVPVEEPTEPTVIMGTVDEVAATTEKAEEVMIPLSKIRLPEKFQGAFLNPQKTAPVREWVQSHGQLDKPIDVELVNGEYWLVDGYRRYVLAKEVGLSEVPVQIK